MKGSLGLIIAAFALSACHTAIIPEPNKNFVPPGMTTLEVQQVILGTIDGLYPTTTGQIIMSDILSAHGVGYNWYVEKVEPHVIRAAILQRYKHYVAVNVQYTQTEWWISIVDGKNIEFDGKNIHENALIWVDSLEYILETAFGAYQVKGQEPRTAVGVSED